MRCAVLLPPLQERLQAHEWGAAGVAFVGVLGLGASAEASHLEHPQISASRVLGSFAVMILLLGAAAAGTAHSPKFEPCMGSVGTAKPSTLSGAGGSAARPR